MLTPGETDTQVKKIVNEEPQINLKMLKEMTKISKTNS